MAKLSCLIQNFLTTLNHFTRIRSTNSFIHYGLILQNIFILFRRKTVLSAAGFNASYI